MRVLGRVGLLAFSLIASCGGDSTGPDDTGAGSTFTATIDGGAASFTGNLSLVGTRSGGTYSFVAEQNAGQGTVRKIILTIENVTGPGTYTFAAPTASSVALFYETTGPVTKIWSSAIAGGSGSVTITELASATVTGTFTFTAPGSASTGANGNKVITNGAFYVIFQQQQQQQQ